MGRCFTFGHVLDMKSLEPIETCGFSVQLKSLKLPHVLDFFLHLISLEFSNVLGFALQLNYAECSLFLSWLLPLIEITGTFRNSCLLFSPEVFGMSSSVALPTLWWCFCCVFWSGGIVNSVHQFLKLIDRQVQ